MSELLYKDEIYKIVGLCMEVHRELGSGQDEVIYKDALAIELQRAGISFAREQKYDVVYKGVVLPHFFFADFVIYDKILFEGKAVKQIAEAHTKQTLNLLAVSKLQLGLLANFGADSLEWKRVVRSRPSIESIDLRTGVENSRQLA
jgi:GxxExxY protein